MFTGRIHFFIEQKEDCVIATRCDDLGSNRPNVKDEYKKFVDVGYLPCINEDALIIKKDTLKELEKYLTKEYPNYRCAYYKNNQKD